MIALKQGVGRLIRDHGDSGVLMICDPRLAQRGYGKRFLRSLPPMQRTDDPARAVAFLRGADPAAPAPTGDDTAACTTPASEGPAP